TSNWEAERSRRSPWIRTAVSPTVIRRTMCGRERWRRQPLATLVATRGGVLRAAKPSRAPGGIMFRRSIRIAALAVIALPVAAFTFGGWAVITVDSLPEFAVAGSPTTLTFAVRQHGSTTPSNHRPH